MRRYRIAAFAFVAAALAVGLILLPGVAEDTSPQLPSKGLKADSSDRPRRQLDDFMHQKLDASSQVLEGLLVEDFEMIEKGGRTLLEMSNTEKWRVSNDMMYRAHSEDFQADVDKLIQAAKKSESLDRVALAWFDTTLSCIECHRWVRNVLIADSDAPLSPLIAPSAATGE